MGIQRLPALIHWNYFLALEEDLDRLGRFVDFSDNENVYSIEIARLLLSACSEVDVVLKQLCKTVNRRTKAESINAYFGDISKNVGAFFKFEVIIPRYNLTLHPWIDWAKDSPPIWWQHHNKVKHNRHDYFDKATLKNCLNSMAGLYVATLYLYRDLAEAGQLHQLPRLFNVSDRFFGGTSMTRHGHSFRYRL